MSFGGKPCYNGSRFSYVHASWICAGVYVAAATHPYPTGTSASLLSSLLRPNGACVAWEHQAPGRAVSASGDCSRLQGGRLHLMEERDSHNNRYLPTNQLPMDRDTDSAMTN